MLLKEHASLIRRAWMVAEASIVGLAFLAARVVTASPDIPPATSVLPLLAFWASVLSWPVWLRVAGCYSSQRTVATAEYWRRLVVAHLSASLGLWALVMVGVLAAPGTDFLVWFACIAFCGLAAERAMMRWLMHVARRGGRNYRLALVVGTGQRADLFASLVPERPEWGLRLIGQVEADAPQDRTASAKSLPVLGRVADVESLLDSRVVDELIVSECSDRPDVREAVSHAETRGLVVRFVTDAPGPPGATVDRERGLAVATTSQRANQELELLVKKAFDVLAASALLVAMAPVAAVIAGLIRLDSKGPVLFRQQRVGLNGRRFVMLKFRTMHAGAERLLPDLRMQNEMKGLAFKLRNDPRVTRVGRWLRASSLDELPQLWNVMRGEMSLVGPRPLESTAGEYAPSQRRRLAMKPGITGPWQVSGRNTVDFDEWIDLDLAYVDRWSLATDLQILLRTIPAVLTGRGAW